MISLQGGFNGLPGIMANDGHKIDGKFYLLADRKLSSQRERQEEGKLTY